LNISGKAISVSSKVAQLTIKVKGKAILGPDGKVIRIAPNGQLFNPSANPILSTSGSPIYIDGKKKALVDRAGKPVKIGVGDKANQIVGKVGKAKLVTA
jgi:hypothetical protein